MKCASQSGDTFFHLPNAEMPISKRSRKRGCVEPATVVCNDQLDGETGGNFQIDSHCMRCSIFARIVEGLLDDAKERRFKA